MTRQLLIKLTESVVLPVSPESVSERAGGSQQQHLKGVLMQMLIAWSLT
ncbi:MULTISPECIES: hypothetical protein [Vibrio]|nr:hypothetical protein [Vibrio natriegens]MDX6029511.1 hypothetical protein [Vibrio natriegens NBRC 15636 = ATCC 14048 = DSM 759]MEE3878990.1 hypothetical protein [Vibrio sp. YYF0003]UUI13791.1 hypothetical protein NP431_22565 [Vibrio natriegens]WRS51401.1 hypothetical protein VER99_17940 [Vibrio natriegens NBRC 15636 = ATCC 14048 = DSM 759]